MSVDRALQTSARRVSSLETQVPAICSGALHLAAHHRQFSGSTIFRPNIWPTIQSRAAAARRQSDCRAGNRHALPADRGTCRRRTPLSPISANNGTTMDRRAAERLIMRYDIFGPDTSRSRTTTLLSNASKSFSKTIICRMPIIHARLSTKILLITAPCGLSNRASNVTNNRGIKFPSPRRERCDRCRENHRADEVHQKRAANVNRAILISTALDARHCSSWAAVS